MKLLQDAEWSGWADAEIARRATVSVDLVNRVRKEIEPDTIRKEVWMLPQPSRPSAHSFTIRPVADQDEDRRPS
jgi:hypothetical protein